MFLVQFNTEFFSIIGVPQCKQLVVFNLEMLKKAVCNNLLLFSGESGIIDVLQRDLQKWQPRLAN